MRAGSHGQSRFTALALGVLVLTVFAPRAWAQRIASGGMHSCVATTDGRVFCWGHNRMLGNGAPDRTTFYQLTPVQASLSAAVEVVAGADHTCARKSDGTVWCWGSNEFGQVGGSDTSLQTLPARVSGLQSAALQVSAGAYHTCALLSDRTVSCWGNNAHGQLGDGTRLHRGSPVRVGGLAGVASIGAGGDDSLYASRATAGGHTCAVLTDGTVRCWGGNAYGQLGDGTFTERLTPVAVSGLSEVRKVEAGTLHTCAIRADRTLWCWGLNSSGQLGNGAVDVLDGEPTPVQALILGVSDVSAGNGFTCAVREEGSTACWGLNDYGQLGNGLSTWAVNNSPAWAPTPVPTRNLLTPVALEVSAGHGFYKHTCALKDDGTVWCWGANRYGETGNGTRTPYNCWYFWVSGACVYLDTWSPAQAGVNWR